MKGSSAMCIRHQPNGLAIVKDVGEFFRFCTGIDDDKHGIGFEYGEQADDQLGAVRQIQDKPIATLQAVGPQGMCQPIGLGLDLGISVAVILAHQAHFIGMVLGAVF
jgi:hypothetical protein